ALGQFVGCSHRVHAQAVEHRRRDGTQSARDDRNAYFVLALGFLQQFRKGAGIGTMLSFTVPVALAVLVSWSSFFALWYALGIPLGPGVPVR
ncbi:AbgT family transporter, partial [Streptomyces asiaticus]